MQLVSPQFQPAIEAPKRQVKARVHLDLVGNFVDKGASVAASSSQNAVAMAPAQAINSRTAPRRKWAAANFLTLDGSYHSIPADGKEETGWWGGKRSSEVGALKQDAPASSFSRPSPAYLSDGTQVASGQPRFEPGKFGQAWMGEEGATNQAGTDNSFETGVNGFMAYGNSTATLSSSTDYTFSGTHSLKTVCVAPGTSGYGVAKVLSSPASFQGKTMTLSWKVRGVGSSIGKAVFANIYDDVSLSTQGAAITLTAEWQTITVTKTIASAGVTLVVIYWLGTLVAGDVVYADCVQFEEKAYATSFTDSTRAAETLTIPTAGVLSATEGTIEVSAYIDPSGVHSASNPNWSFVLSVVTLQQSPYAELNQISIRRVPSSTNWIVCFSNASGVLGTIDLGFITVPGWYRFGVSWKSGVGGYGYLDGIPKGSVASSLLPSSFAQSLSIGTWNVTGFHLNSLIDDLRLSSIARSDAEILSEVQSNAPLPVDKWTTYKLPLDDTLNAEQATNETLTITFPARKVKTFWWHGDPIRGWYPTDFKVEYYDSQAASWVLVADVTGWASPYWETSLAAITAKVVTQIRLTIPKVAPAGSCACILEFDATVTETYEGDDLVSLGLLEEMEADTGTLAIGNISSNEVDLRLNNIDRRFNPGNTASAYYGLLKPNRRIRPYLGVVLADGTTEYVPLGIFWSGDWDARADSLEATTSGQDLLKFMAESTFSVSQVYVNKTLHDLAVIVLQDYGLQDTDYEIDADLTNYVIPYAWFDKTSHRAALQRIAEAGLAAVFMARDGRLKIKSYRFLAGATSLGQVSDQVHIINSNNPQRNSQVVNTVEVEANPLKADVSKVIYQTTEAVTVPAGGTKSLTVFFTEKPAINVGAPVLSGAVNTVVQSWTAYAWGGDLVLSNPGGAAENVNFTVSGQPLVEAGRILAKAQDATRVAEEGVIKKSVSNDLIQTTALAQSVADAILAVWSNAAKDVVSQVRGDPSWELGDRRTWADDRANVTGDHVIIRQRLEYDGGLAGEVTGRRV